MSLPTNPVRRRLHRLLYAPAVHPGWSRPLTLPKRRGVHPHWLGVRVAPPPLPGPALRLSEKRLSDETVRAIRAAWRPYSRTHNIARIATATGLGYDMVKRIVEGRTYRSVA